MVGWDTVQKLLEPEAELYVGQSMLLGEGNRLVFKWQGRKREASAEKL